MIQLFTKKNPLENASLFSLTRLSNQKHSNIPRNVGMFLSKINLPLIIKLV